MKSFLIFVFLMAIGVFEATSTNYPLPEHPEFLSPEDKAFFLTQVYMRLYVSHPEFSKQVRSQLSEKENNIFKSVTEGCYKCWNSSPKDTDKTRKECIKSMVKSYDIEEINKIIEAIKKANKDLSAEKTRDVTVEYYGLFDFYIDFMQWGFSRQLSLNVFNQQEKEFIVTLVEKFTKSSLSMTDFGYAVELSEFMKDSEIFKQVCEKVAKIPKGNTTKSGKSSPTTM